MQKHAACVDCVFWEAINDLDDRVRGGYCRRHAPRPVSALRRDAGEVEANWPVTEPEDFCGEYQGKGFE
jgi:hypothetical protein